MNLFMSFRMALQSILSNKVRSVLTMLGIIIGVLSVIVMVNLVNASMMDMRAWMDRMGTNIIQASLYRNGSTTRSVTPSDVERLVKDNPDCLLYSSPTLDGSATVKSTNRNFSGRVMGVSEQYGAIQKLEMAYGKFFSRSDLDARASVAVIGEYPRQQLFGSRNPVGQTIRINGEVFTVVGVYKQIDDELTEWGEDSRIFIPYTRAMRIFKNTTVSEYLFASVDADTSKQAEEKIKELFYRTFRTEEYWVYNQAENMKEMNDQINGMTLLAAAIAGISLLVGGIGIMNIMTVSVSERTREIGIRKAIGARTTDILMQFLIESVVLSGMGGVVGIMFGVGVGLACNALGLTYVTQFNMVLLSFVFSLAVGIFFGLAPANKAAKLNPIEALRSE
ncbi:MAG: ABC transporter permease [Clostridia bacterium]